MKKKLLLTGILSCLLSNLILAQDPVTGEMQAGGFPLVSPSGSAVLYTDKQDFVLVQKVAACFREDIRLVTGMQISLTHALAAAHQSMIIVGTIGKSALIDQLISRKKINAEKIRGKWEAYQIQTVRNPFNGIGHALVIMGSDRRGCAYGIFQLSQEIGVSPWYWWADVPVKKKKNLYIRESVMMVDSPSVKYRGIFINDEAPALSGWTKEKFGGFNHQFYEKVFELILRLKGNYLWPAMWGNAFYDDDSLNKKTADDYGIVIGTSHHEPLLRAHDEWRRYGKGQWNYDSNETRLRAFWKEGMERAKGTETIVSVGMRGDGDKPMTQGTAISLLERIVKDQRNIIEEVTGKPASKTPQLWALYKEVQDYYDKGMRVPDDVTLLLCDDNWGNIRRLPTLNDKPRSGGYGIYYHFDYVGDPRNYKWLNTNQIERVWEQMHLAYEYKVRQIWIVNVGDIKPMELPISFFLDYAWKPARWNAVNLPAYYRQWAGRQFGTQYARDIATLLTKYTQYNSRRKPELLSPGTYSLLHYNEAASVVTEYNSLREKAEKINKSIPAEYKDAFFELVLHPIEACANLNEMYLAAARNKFYSTAGTLSYKANLYADSVKYFFKKDSLISHQYNKELAGGKWDHMMDQTHIGYTYWQQPEKNKMPDVTYINTGAAPGENKMSAGTDGRKKNASSTSPSVSASVKGNSFYEAAGCVSIEAADYTRAVPAADIRWQVIKNIGRDGSGITVFPVTAAKRSETGQQTGPRLEYKIYTRDSGKAVLYAYFSPTLNFHHDGGLQYAISIDDEQPQIISINKEDNNNRLWEEWVANNIIIKSTEHQLSKAGMHTIKYWMVDPAVILQKLVLDLGGMQSSYLGPPETKFK